MPPKKTSKQKELEGTDRADRSGEIPSVDKIPSPSKSLSKGAIPYYAEIAQHLLENGNLQTVDRLLIERAAKCFFSLLEAEKILDKKGAIAIGRNKSEYISPYFNLVQSYEKRWLDYCKELGIGAKARHLMAASFVKKEEKKVDPFQLAGGSKPSAA